MSIRAYIRREDNIWLDAFGKVYTSFPNNSNNGFKMYTNIKRDFCFNITRQSKIVDELLRFGAQDYTNTDFVGTLEIDRENFIDFFYNNHCITTRDYESILLMKEYFLEDENNKILILDCL